MVRVLLDALVEHAAMMKPSQTYLTDEDIRYELGIMVRWCRFFRKTALDWVNLEAELFRDRHPVLPSEPESAVSHAAPLEQDAAGAIAMERAVRVGPPANAACAVFSSDSAIGVAFSIPPHERTFAETKRSPAICSPSEP